MFINIEAIATCTLGKIYGKRTLLKGDFPALRILAKGSVQITWKITGSTSAGSGNDREVQPGSQASNYND